MPLCSLCQQITPWTLPESNRNGMGKLETSIVHHQSSTSLQRSAMECELCYSMYVRLFGKNLHMVLPSPANTPVLLANYCDDDSDGPECPSPNLSRIWVQCGSKGGDLVAFAKEGSELALSNTVTGRLPAPPNSRESFEWIRESLERCMNTHAKCRLTDVHQDLSTFDLSAPDISIMPSRFLDVGFDSIKLVNSDTKAEGHYVALSHRWPNNPSSFFTTTKSSIESRQHSIDINEMPKTFRDAVIVTRAVGLRYLWIDSLCIIQDDSNDWEVQSALMGRIYRQATMTIMAATTLRGTHGQTPEGFLHSHAPPPCADVKMQHTTGEDKPITQWGIRALEFKSTTEWDLLTRGWVLQERLLSRRKLYFTSEQLRWECRQLRTTEVDRKYIRRADDSRGLARFWEDQYFASFWFMSVQTYSGLDLTYESDKLPALSGIASYLSQRHGQFYRAGLFSGYIAEGLLWRPGKLGSLVRSQRYLAPSWSWLSLNGEVRQAVPGIGTDNYDPNDKSPWKSMLENVIINLVPKGEDPNGAVLDGRMELTGLLKSAQMSVKDDSERNSDTTMNLEIGGGQMVTFDLDLLESAPAVGDKQDVECLYVLDYEEYDELEPAIHSSNALILRQVNGGEQYERIGAAKLDPEWFASGGTRKESITII